MPVPVCVLFLCVCLCESRCFFFGVFVCEVHLGCCLLLRFSENARSVGVTFSPQSELHLLGQGVSSHWASFAGSWSRAGLCARRSEVGEEGEDQANSQGARTSGLFDGRSLKTGLGGGMIFFCLGDNNTHANYNFAHSKDKYSSNSNITATPSAGVCLIFLLLSIKFE